MRHVKKWTWKKTVAGVGVALTLLVGLSFFLVSNPMMDYYQRRIDRSPDDDSSRWLQIASADVCYATWRPERAADFYRRFLDRYREDLRRPYAFLRFALSMEECGRNAD